jgi:hypothetical protein
MVLSFICCLEDLIQCDIMTSFGFSLGDVIAVSSYAHKLYKSCKNARDSFKAITTDGAYRAISTKEILLTCGMQ